MRRALSYFKDNLEYNPQTGAIAWKDVETVEYTRRGMPLHTHKRDGTLWIQRFDRAWAVHRLAWFLYYGEWPQFYLIHKNGDKTDNRIDNLCRRTKQTVILYGSDSDKARYGVQGPVAGNTPRW